MFLLPFLHYLKPFRGRLALALLCMIVVSGFGAVNVLMLKFPLEILLGQKTKRPGQKVEQTVNEDSKEHPSKPGKSNAIPSGVRQWWNDATETPRRAIVERKEALTRWYEEESASNPFRVLYFLCGFLLVMTFIKCFSEYIAEYELAYSFYFVNAKMREDIYRNILAQDYLFFTKSSPGYLISRINSDTTALKNIIDKLLNDGIQQPLTLIAYMLALLWTSPQLTLVALLMLPGAAALLYYFSRALRKNTSKQKKKADELSGIMAEGLHSIRLVKAFGSEAFEDAKFVQRNRMLFKYVMANRLPKFASGPIMEFLGTISACGVLMMGGYMILGDHGFLGTRLTASEFFVYLFILSRFYRPLKSLSNTTMIYQVGRVSAERIQEMLKIEPTVKERPNALPLKEIRQGIELRNVSFRYMEKEILRDVSLQIPRGKKVALVGKTGSGKTSIANLIPRLFDPNEGEVLIDGVNLKDYKIADLRRAMGIVQQQTILFDDSVANNIGYASDMESPEQKRAAVIEAAKAAYADEFIRHLDGGKEYDTRLGPSGMKLSGGQSQRIAIARAIFRNPQLLILDEATSSLDSQAQAQVQSAINNLIQERTSLIIAHRLSTIRNADYIYVLDAGRVVEEGTHTELMAKRGAYFKLYQTEDTEVETEGAESGTAEFQRTPPEMLVEGA